MTTKQVDLTDIRKRIERQFDQGYIASGTADLLQLMVNHLEAREAWEKNREATEALLLGMVEKLTPAAQETTGFRYGITTDGEVVSPEQAIAKVRAAVANNPLATPQPAICRHMPDLQRMTFDETGVRAWCVLCGDRLRADWKLADLPQPPAPQQTEG